MTMRDDLSEANAALRELVRLQLAGELAAKTAWQARREMLDSVEAAWHDLSQDLTPEALASKQVLPGPLPVRLSWRERWQKIPTLPKRIRPPVWQSLSWQMPRLSQWSGPRALRTLAHLPWWSLFLVAALVTFYYVSTL